MQNNRINKIINGENNVRCMTIIIELLYMINYGGDERNLTIIDLISNEIADIWQVENTIKYMDDIFVKDGKFILAIGCQDGSSE